MKKIFSVNSIISLLFVIIFAVACDKADPYAEIQADYEIAVGEEFEIEFDANHTTGYMWQWINETTVSIVDTVGRTYTAGTGIGAGGKETWTFKGISEGLDTVMFDYSQSWNELMACDTTTYIIRVK
ncbi:MAG: protease inhibitor I42 family protein [Prolixibacteraceae bacterium]|nr:protease inhibitor I42 family protein [Prolixibacteraceae bacterium]